MRDLAEDFGNSGKILGWYRGPRPVIYSTNPDFLKEVFIKESETYIDRPMLDQSDNVPHLIMLKGDFFSSSFFCYLSRSFNRIEKKKEIPASQVLVGRK